MTAGLAGSVALVTGCGKRDGMGRSIARMLAGSGASVLVCDKQPAGVLNRRQELVPGTDGGGWRGVDSLVSEITAEGGTASRALGDIGDENDAQRLIGEAVARYGRLDILVNNAAAPQGLDRRDITEVPIDVWDHVVRVNLRGTFLMSRFAIPVMRGQRSGRIVNISSMAGVVAVPRSAAYAASKAAVIALTRSMALDVAAWGITVNAICPGAVGTSRAILNEDPDLDVGAELERRGRNIPVGRVGRPEDIAAAVAYLVDAGADYMTGQILVLDGGGHSAFPVPRPPSP
ncbi:MAG TPA: SDR family oxidoreductase [Streptosporangiaceae bacterium]|nr:SDR family oxidoreductase [Streptosporangiaceae bacterium]